MSDGAETAILAGRRLFCSFALVAVLAVTGCAVGVRHAPTYVSADGRATLNGAVLSTDGGPGSYYIDYGATPAKGRRTPTRSISFAAGEIYPVAEPVSAIGPGTTYYAVCAEDVSNAGDPYCSPDRVFTSPTGSDASRGIAYTFRLLGDPTEDDDLAGNGLFTDSPNDTSSENRGEWSPDGSRVAFVSDRDGNEEIYVMNADGTGQERLTSSAGVDVWPAWSPDGERIAFFSGRTGGAGPGYYVMSADGSDASLLTTPPDDQVLVPGRPTWSPDGSKLALTAHGASSSNTEIVTVNVDGSGWTPLTDSPGPDAQPAWSPDGDKIAFESAGRESDSSVSGHLPDGR